MSTEFNQLQSFIRQLAKSGMRQADIAVRGYDYALLLCQAKEDPKFPRDTELPTLLKIHIMDHAADLLKDALQYGIERDMEEDIPAGLKISPMPKADDEYIERLRVVINGYRKLVGLYVPTYHANIAEQVQKIDHLAWGLGIGVGTEPGGKSIVDESGKD